MKVKTTTYGDLKYDLRDRLETTRDQLYINNHHYRSAPTAAFQTESQEFRADFIEGNSLINACVFFKRFPR